MPNTEEWFLKCRTRGLVGHSSTTPRHNHTSNLPNPVFEDHLRKSTWEINGIVDRFSSESLALQQSSLLSEGIEVPRISPSCKVSTMCTTYCGRSLGLGGGVANYFSCGWVGEHYCESACDGPRFFCQVAARHASGHPLRLVETIVVKVGVRLSTICF